ncbi:unnamed protein product [Rotaria sp. Silwood2]|nr:unnamed protein product [Rotaria sp. Silwood2]CAF4272085.1 unnamed protein product [Rotaria sp. Silwood2]CAF4363893.1 unnamed protein product [Rotaria sp. Silwood2]CAF4493516.1 unnamed protein product [Rotaria sp. Silwood2]
MANTIEAQMDTSLNLSPKKLSLTREIEVTKDEQHKVNTNLGQENQSSIVIEATVSNSDGLVQLVESNSDNTTNQVDQLTTQLTETIKIPEAVQNNLEDHQTAVDQLYQENSNISTELQERIERAELRATTAEPRIVSLEQDIRSAYVQMKSLILSKETIRSKEDNYQKNIAELQARLTAAKQRSTEAKMDVGKMQLKIGQLQGILYNF